MGRDDSCTAAEDGVLRAGVTRGAGDSFTGTDGGGGGGGRSHSVFSGASGICGSAFLSLFLSVPIIHRSGLRMCSSTLPSMPLRSESSREMHSASDNECKNRLRDCECDRRTNGTSALIFIEANDLMKYTARNVNTRELYVSHC